jgi:hypothetical protein
LYIFAALLVYFEIYLMKPIRVFGYVDELLTVLCLAKILLDAFKKRLDRNQTYMLLLMLLLLGIGLVSNYYTKLQENPEAIFTDVGNTFKVFVTYIGATLYLKPVKDKKRIIKTMASVMRLFVVVLFGGLLLHLSGLYAMGNDVRYGIPSYQFINDGAAQLSVMFFSMLVILVADMRYDRHKRQLKMLFIIIAAIVWAFTLRTRAFLYIAIFFALYWLLVVKEKQIKLNWKTILLMGIFLLVFSLDQIDTYFGENKTARYWFVYFGIYTMNNYFPFGAGFACYGTDAAVKYYARLYIRYGFPRIWGLSPEKPYFAHDTYWPAIMAQFGYIGLVVVILIVIRWVMDVLSRTKYNKYTYLVGLFIVTTQIASSVAEATFFHFVTAALCFILPVLFDESAPQKDQSTP